MSTLEKKSWGQTESGEPVDLYTLHNRNGVEACITTFGGRLVTLKTPDREGHLKNVVLGFDTLEGYLGKNPYFGALVGRYANRIARGEFSLDGRMYHLARNNGENSLHGGLKGFDEVVWQGREVSDAAEPALELRYRSVDGEEGYPGNLDVTVSYALTDADEIRIDYKAETDKDTVLNLTNHSYFDLSGEAAGDIVDLEVSIHADRFTPVNEHLIPTGVLQPVEGTPFDFRKPLRVGARIDEKNQQLKYALGYDHNFVLNRNGTAMARAARAKHPKSGRVLEVETTQPGMQFYTGNHLDGTVTGKAGVAYEFRSGVCFETQHYPDSPNHPQFPTTELKAGSIYRGATVFRFTTD